RDIDRVGPDRLRGIPDVFRGQAPGEDHRAHARGGGGDGPLDDPARPAAADRVVRVEQHGHLRRQTLDRGETESLANGQRLDERQRRGTELRGVFIAMELHGVDAGTCGGLEDIRGGLIHEHANPRDECRQAVGDRADGVGGHGAGAAWPEDEAQRPRAELHRQQRVRTAADSADLDACHTATPRRAFSAAPGSGWAINRSPTRKAAYPAAESRARSSAVRIPLSATAVTDPGTSVAAVSSTRMSTASVLRFRLLTPTTLAPASRARVISPASCTSTTQGRASP